MSDVLSSAKTSAEPRRPAPVRISVCTMCNDRRRGSGGMQAGRYLHADIAAQARDSLIEVVPIECMSVCRAMITLSFTAEGKWAHVFAVPSDTAPADVIEAARLYARSRTGLFPLHACEPLRKGVVARVPPASPSRDGAHGS